MGNMVERGETLLWGSFSIKYQRVVSITNFKDNAHGPDVFDQGCV